MADFKVSVERIEIYPHPNADQMEVAKVGMFQLVVGKANGYRTGDLVAFAPKRSILPEDLRKHYVNSETGISYLSGTNKDRVSSIRLRGELSEGVTIPLSYVVEKLKTPIEEIPIGEDISEKLGITEYEIPLPIGFSGELQKLGDLSYTNHDVEQINIYADEFSSEEPVYLSEKIHGCLPYNTRIRMADGSWESIGKIVNSKINYEVMGVDSDGKIVKTKVLTKFNNGKTSNWLEIKFDRTGFGHGGNAVGVIRTTPNHLFWSESENKYVEAKNLQIGNKITAIKNCVDLTYLQEQVLIGKMLGDGSFNQNRISFGHKIEHIEYFRYTKECLGNLCGTFEEKIISGYGSEIIRTHTSCHPSIKDTFSKWIKGKKIVPKNLVLSPISLAFLYMDDGSLTHSCNQEDRASFAVCGFDEKSVKNILKAMKNIGINGEISNYIDREAPRIRINLKAKEATKLFYMISPYVPQCMQYKLPLKFRDETRQVFKFPIETSRIPSTQTVITSIEEINNAMIKYDIETETHNFFANSILVHNSQLILLIEKDGNIHISSKGLLGKGIEIKEDNHNIYWQALRNTNVVELLKSLWPNRNIQAFGEAFPAQGTNWSYGAVIPTLRLFRIVIDGLELMPSEAFKTPELKALWVPILYEGPYDLDTLRGLAKGKEQVSGKQLHKREGGVVIPMIPRKAKKGGFYLALKLISPDFKDSDDNIS